MLVTEFVSHCCVFSAHYRWLSGSVCAAFPLSLFLMSLCVAVSVVLLLKVTFLLMNVSNAYCSSQLKFTVKAALSDFLNTRGQ